ncbi:MAG: DMT family transporter [Alphaproteobacteria bacterium]
MAARESRASHAAGVLALGAGMVPVTIWGATPIVTELALEEIDALAVAMLRVAGAALVAWPVALALRLVPPRGSASRALLLVSGLSGFVVFPVLFTLGLRYTSASHGALILAVLPVLTGLYLAALERRLPPLAWWLGVALAGMATSALIGFRLGLDLGPDPVTGDLLVLAASAVASAGYVAGARLSRHLGAAATAFWGAALGGLAVAPFLTWWIGSCPWPEASPGAWLGVGYLAVMASIVAYLVWYWALDRGGIARVAALQFLQPVVSLALAALFLGERITPALAASAACIVTGVWLARRSP